MNPGLSRKNETKTKAVLFSVQLHEEKIIETSNVLTNTYFNDVQHVDRLPIHSDRHVITEHILWASSLSFLPFPP